MIGVDELCLRADFGARVGLGCAVLFSGETHALMNATSKVSDASKSIVSVERPLSRHVTLSS